MKEDSTLIIQDSPVQQSDDLTMIEGIEPAFEKRLNSAGIHTFAELQSKSPEVLAKLFIGQKGVSARLIREMDWIGQARQLSDEIKSQDTLMQSQAEQHYAVFTVELLLDKENNVRRTRAKSVSSSDQSGQTEESFSGWEPESLLQFFIDQAQLSIPHQKPKGDRSAQADTIPEETDLTGRLQISRINLQHGVDGNGMHLIQQGALVNFNLELDFSRVKAPAETSLNYRASIYTKELDSGTHQMIGEATGEISPIHQSVINVGIKSLEPGLYRLYAIVVIALPGTEPKPGSGLMAMMEGGLIPVI